MAVKQLSSEQISLFNNLIEEHKQDKIGNLEGAESESRTEELKDDVVLLQSLKSAISEKRELTDSELDKAVSILFYNTTKAKCKGSDLDPKELDAIALELGIRDKVKKLVEMYEVSVSNN